MPMEASSSLHLLCAELPTTTLASAGLLERMQSVQRAPADLFAPIEHPPPDLQSLNATFLI